MHSSAHIFARPGDMFIHSTLVGAFSSEISQPSAVNFGTCAVVNVFELAAVSEDD